MFKFRFVNVFRFLEKKLIVPFICFNLLMVVGLAGAVVSGSIAHRIISVAVFLLSMYPTVVILLYTQAKITYNGDGQ